MERIILASGSPRRQEYFRLMGLPFTCMPSSIDETPKPGLSPKQIAEDLAARKALAVAAQLPPIDPNPSLTPHSSFPISHLIFGADTIVVLDGEIYGKADSREEAKAMLLRLSGKRHEVITAMALHNRQNGKTDCRSVSAEVEFAPLADADIEWYLESGEWQGAAGSYRLQERGGCLIKSITGSPSAVAGLPLHEFFVMLKDNGCRIGA